MMKNKTYALSGIATALQYALTHEEFEKLTDLLQDVAQEKFADLDDEEMQYGFRDGIKNSYADLVYDLGEAMGDKEQEKVNHLPRSGQKKR